MESHVSTYPFAAIVGQEDMKRALILNVINPRIGGVLIRGEKGTAKSTAVRALAAVLPLRAEVLGCRFACDPDAPNGWCDECGGRAEIERIMAPMRVVNLPVSATEDRVVGTLDIEYALKQGKKRFEPGILAGANRNILYIDEVNLLEDHVVDILLDAAAMGVNRIEREGISYSHPASFTLVGTMNPEEGDLRPQFLDRFGLVVDVYGEHDVAARKEIVRRRLAFEMDPDAFCERFAREGIELGKRIESAKKGLKNVVYGEDMLSAATEIVVAMETDGHRADITMIKTAITNAAFEGRAAVTGEDLRLAARLALPHRMRRQPFEESVVDMGIVNEIIRRYEER